MKLHLIMTCDIYGTEINKLNVGYHVLYLAHESFTRGYLKLQQMLLLSTKVQKSFFPIQNVHVHFSLVPKWTPYSVECDFLSIQIMT